MNRLSLSLPSALLVALLIFIAGCGGSESSPDPQVVLDTALSSDSLHSAPGTKATVQVQALGDQDRVLDARTVPVSYEILTQLEDTLSLSDGSGGANTGNTGSGDAGAKTPKVVSNLKSEGSTQVGDVDVDQISGDLDVKALANELEKVSGTADGTGKDRVEVPGLAGLADIQDTIEAATFDLYAAKDGGSLQQADLTLSLASQSSMPATRIRFRLSGVQSDQGN